MELFVWMADERMQIASRNQTYRETLSRKSEPRRGSELYFGSIVTKTLDNSSTGRDSKLGKRMQRMQEEEDQARNPNIGPTSQSSS